MFKNITREKVFNWIVYDLFKHPENQELSRTFAVLRLFLMPLDTFYWFMSETRGYDLMRNQWQIAGEKYHNNFFVDLAKAGDEETVLVEVKRSATGAMQIIKVGVVHESQATQIGRLFKEINQE